MRAQREAERQAIRRIQELRAELVQVRREIEEAERAYDLNRAAELRYSIHQKSPHRPRGDVFVAVKLRRRGPGGRERRFERPRR